MKEDLDLTGRSALVTGGSSGIGQACAVALAGLGARVAIGFHRNQAGAERTREEIEAGGGSATTIRADLTRSDEVERLIEAAREAIGEIDVLVNNAGSMVQRLGIAELTDECWDEAVSLNLTSPFLCARAVAPRMIERGSGAIINIGSLAARNGGAIGSIHYATTKAGLVAFTKGLAKELAPHGVRVNAVNPGIIQTPFQDEFSTAEKIEGFVAATPLGRVGTPEEVARVVAFLASDAASFVVGETVEVNGGIAMY